jgi:hypothetical protein
MRPSILNYRGARFAGWALALMVSAVLVFVSHSDYLLPNHGQPPNGGTWQGYVLGSVALVLIVWLSALGIAKRRYGRVNLQAWTSAHVYLGSALLIVASFHSAMQFGFNVHTLAYVLMCVVIFSGMVGLYFYLGYPRKMALNRHNQSRQQLFAELNQLNQQAQVLANRCHANVRTAVETTVARTSIGGGLLDQLLARDHSSVEMLVEGKGDEVVGKEVVRKQVANTDQRTVIDYIAKCIPRARKQGEAGNLQNLLEILCRRQTVLGQLRRDIAYAARLKVWLWVHIPGTVALLVALALHVVSVFFYW